MPYLAYSAVVICLYCSYTEVLSDPNLWNPMVHECEPWEITCYPTITDSPNFNSSTDATDLFMATIDNDYVKLIDIMAKRSQKQRELIIHEYKNKFELDFIRILKQKLTDDDFRDFVLALLKPLSTFYKDELKVALSSGTDKHLNVLDIMGPLSNQGRRAVRIAYFYDVGHFIDFDLQRKIKMNMDHLNLFKNLIYEIKPEGSFVNHTLIPQDVNDLIDSEGGLLTLTDYAVCSRLMLNRNNCHLREMYKKFLEKRRNRVENTVLARSWTRCDDKYRSSLVGLYLITKNRAMYFADRLHYSLNRWGLTDHATVRRIIIGRAEIDLENIKIAYESKYRRFLASMISRKTNGLHQMILLKLIEDPPKRIPIGPSAKSTQNISSKKKAIKKDAKIKEDDKTPRKPIEIPLKINSVVLPSQANKEVKVESRDENTNEKKLTHQDNEVPAVLVKNLAETGEKDFTREDISKITPIDSAPAPAPTPTQLSEKQLSNIREKIDFAKNFLKKKHVKKNLKDKGLNKINEPEKRSNKEGTIKKTLQVKLIPSGRTFNETYSSEISSSDMSSIKSSSSNMSSSVTNSGNDDSRAKEESMKKNLRQKLKSTYPDLNRNKYTIA